MMGEECTRKFEFEKALIKLVAAGGKSRKKNSIHIMEDTLELLILSFTVALLVM